MSLLPSYFNVGFSIIDIKGVFTVYVDLLKGLVSLDVCRPNQKIIIDCKSSGRAGASYVSLLYCSGCLSDTSTTLLQKYMAT